MWDWCPFLDGRYGYQLGSHGRWIGMHLKKPKKKGGGGKKKQVNGGGAIPSGHDLNDHDHDEDESGEDGEETQASLESRTRRAHAQS